MDLVKIFTTKEEIGGLSVSENAVRFVLLEHDKNQGNKVVIKAIVEEPLPAGTIEDGAIKDTAKFSEAVLKLKDKSPYKIDYVILTIPDLQTYSKIFYFPKVITGEKLKETMRVTIGFSLPVKISDVYLDWEKLDTERNELFLQTLPKKVADIYVETLNNLGISVVALESNALSMARVINLREEPILVIERNEGRISMIIIKNKIVRFIRIFKKELNEKELLEEINRISNFYEVEDTPIYAVAKIEETDAVPQFTAHPTLKEKSYLWLPALGSALRGLMPRSKDELISLLPVGTEEAYETQKNIAFAKLISDSVTAISIFFIIAFIGSWIFIASIANNMNAQIAQLASIPLPQNAVIFEEEAREFNQLVSVVSDIDGSSPRWSRLLTEIREITGTGISIRTISVNSPTDSINISGISSTREDMNIFRRSVENSEVFTNVSIPIANLELRSNIPFSMTANLSNQSFLYE